MRVSLKAALAGSFSLLAVVAAVQGGLSIVRLSAIDREVREIADNWLPSVGLLGDISTATRDERVKTYRYVSTSDTPQLLAENEKSVRASQKTLADLRRAYEPLIASPEERAVYERFSATWATYTTRLEEIVGLMQAGRRAEALTLLAGADTLALAQNATRTLQENLALNKRGAKASVDQAVGSAASAATTAWIAMAVTLLAALMAALFGWRGISRPIENMTAAMGRLAAGDATLDVPGRGRRDEIGA
ncbi:MCP four helix bundle domain-containing protein, partial [Methylorubrum suomiense]|uniref:MCP four helix bundle domain-containing protein n=1 Tax=Methylorubrum suomiense TaxID=144191 RepID=UPI0036429CDF